MFEKTSAECNEDSYLAILHLSRVELHCKLQEKLHRVTWPLWSYAGFPCEFFGAKRIFHLSLVSQLEPSGINWIKTKEKFASREKIHKWKTDFIKSVSRLKNLSTKLNFRVN